MPVAHSKYRVQAVPPGLVKIYFALKTPSHKNYTLYTPGDLVAVYFATRRCITIAAFRLHFHTGCLDAASSIAVWGLRFRVLGSGFAFATGVEASSQNLGRGLEGKGAEEGKNRGASGVQRFGTVTTCGELWGDLSGEGLVEERYPAHHGILVLKERGQVRVYGAPKALEDLNL